MQTIQTLGSTEVSPPPLSSRHRSELLHRKMPGLDILRGIAILLVVFAHTSVPASGGILVDTHEVRRILAVLSPGGWAGVELFFVLSGFLITGILLDTRDRVDYWKNFYIRRALRILPLYLVTLLIIHFWIGVSWLYVLCCLIFIANLVEARMPGYGPLWSLAVEEQFYLAWPLLVRRLPLRSLAILCLISITASPLLRILSGHLPLGNPYDATWLISDFLSVGAFVAIFLRSRLSTKRNVRLLAMSFALLFVIFLLVCIRFHLLTHATILGSALMPEPVLFLSAFLLLVALRYGNLRPVLLCTAPLRFYGYISYGLYLLNYGFAYYFFGPRNRALPTGYVMTPFHMLLRTVPEFALVTAIALLSRRYFEEYFLRLKERMAKYLSRRKGRLQKDG